MSTTDKKIDRDMKELDLSSLTSNNKLIVLKSKIGSKKLDEVLLQRLKDNLSK